MKIKQIKWEKVRVEGFSWYQSKTNPIIEYCIEENDLVNLWIYAGSGNDKKLGTFKTLEKAQAVAQSHFERIIGKWVE